MPHWYRNITDIAVRYVRTSRIIVNIHGVVELGLSQILLHR